MEQRFEVISYKGGFLTIDNNNNYPGNLVYSTVTKSITIFTDPRHFSDNTVFTIIAATSNLNLKYIPVLIMSEDESKALAKKTYIQYPGGIAGAQDINYGKKMKAFIKGFNQAKSKYKWTDEDMIKAMDKYSEICYDRHNDMNTEAPTLESIKQSILDDLYKSKIPKSVYLEMEENQCDGCKSELPLNEFGIHNDNQKFGIRCTKERYNKPKLTPNNEVIAIRWEY